MTQLDFGEQNNLKNPLSLYVLWEGRGGGEGGEGEGRGRGGEGVREGGWSGLHLSTLSINSIHQPTLMSPVHMCARCALTTTAAPPRPP